MKIQVTLLIFITIVLLLVDAGRNEKGNRKGRRSRNRRRKCEFLCKGFARYLDARVFRSAKADGGSTTEASVDFVGSVLRKYTVMRGFQNTDFETQLQSKINDFHKAFVDGAEIDHICESVKVCKGFSKKLRIKSSRRKGFGGIKTCKMCQDIMRIVVSVVDLGNGTWHRVDDLVKDACKMYIVDTYIAGKCLKMMDRISQIEDIMTNKISGMSICKSIGICGNVSEEVKQSCVSDMKTISPWQTAFSVARSMANMFTGDSSMVGFAKDMMRTAFISQVGECLSNVKSQMVVTKSRRKRSIKAPRCQVCSKMSERAMEFLRESDDTIDHLSHHLHTLCSSVSSPIGKRRCSVITSLANSTDTMLTDIMSPELCHRMPCGLMKGSDLSSKSCDLCHTISKIIMKDVKYLGSTIDFVIEEVQMLCSEYAEPGTAKACIKITKILQNVEKYMESEFMDNKICTELGVC